MSQCVMCGTYLAEGAGMVCRECKKKYKKTRCRNGFVELH